MPLGLDNHTYRAPTYGRTKFNWEFPYYMINQANIGIKGLNESNLSDTDKNELMAQFLGLRGFYYFQLALEYNHHPSYNTEAGPSNFTGQQLNLRECPILLTCSIKLNHI